MDHDYIKEHNLVELYLMEKLPRSERKTLEAHLFDCEKCLDELESNAAFLEGIRSLSAEEVLRGRTFMGLGLAGRLGKLTPLGQAGAVVAALLLFAVPITIISIENTRLRSQLDAARISDGRREIGSEEKEKPGAAGDTGSTASEETPPRVTAQQESPAIEKGSAPIRATPQINTPVFVLASLRQTPAARSQTVNEFTLSRHAGSFLVSIGLEVGRRYESYRVKITDASGKNIWNAAGLQPDKHEAFAITFPNEFFKPGYYELTLEGVENGGAIVTLEEYPLQIIRSK